jgi:N-acetylmuramoyl-L-alanine amidase
MTLQLKTLTDTLRTARQNTDFSKVESSTINAKNNFDANNKTVLGATIDEEKGGVKAITQPVDVANGLSSESVVTRATQAADDTLTGSVGGQASAINLITGNSTASANGFMHEIVGLGTPEAVSKSLSSVTGKSVSKFSSNAQALTSSDLQSVVKTSVGNIPYQDFNSKTSTYSNQLKQVIGSNSENFMLDLGEKISKNYALSIGDLVDLEIPESEIEESFKHLVDGNFDKGASIITKYIDYPEDYNLFVNNYPQSEWPTEVLTAFNRQSEAAAGYRTFDVSLSSYVNQYAGTSDAAGLNTLGFRDISSQRGNRNGVDTSGDSWNFDDITSIDELEAIFRNVNRKEGKEILGAIVHWSGTFLDQNIGSEWIHSAHKNRGFSGIGYHIVIRRDGTLQRGRPLNRGGAHDINNNQNFLGFCFVGGINEYSSRAIKPYWRYASVDSLTPAQFNAYDVLIKTFYKVFPYAQLQGHYATSTEGKIDPGFDVPGYTQSKLGIQNTIQENDSRWKSETPITLNEVLV